MRREAAFNRKPERAIGLWKNSFDRKTRTALEAGPRGGRVLGRPGPVGT